MRQLMAAYQLTEADLDVFDDDPPSIRAARNPNPLVFSAILREGIRQANSLGANAPPWHLAYINRNFAANNYVIGAIHCIYNSPLVAAINATLPQNVATILAAGADPNGIMLRDLDEYSVRFIRGRDPQYNTYSYVLCPPRSKVMSTVAGGNPGQVALLTPNEIADRRKTFSRFWTEPELPTIRFRSTAARTALETAASVGNVALFDQVRAAQPDESWWTVDPTPSHLPDQPTHSAFCTSSPVHEAIMAQKSDMLRHLLDIGYSPNVLPLAATTRCFSPLAVAVAFCDPPNIEAYHILIHHPTTNPTLRTPIFSIHILHFATARLDLPLLQHILTNQSTPLETAGTTSLGHTLLHVASLPLTDVHINLFSPKIFHSIHDVRTLDTKHWLPINLRRRKPSHRGILHSQADTLPLPPGVMPKDEEDARKQAEMVLWLLLSGMQDVAAQDVYGNTPLHYLASAMRVNEELLTQVRARQGAESVWKESKNELGYTPGELWEDGKAAVREQWKEFWFDS